MLQTTRRAPRASRAVTLPMALAAGVLAVGTALSVPASAQTSSSSSGTTQHGITPGVTNTGGGNRGTSAANTDTNANNGTTAPSPVANNPNTTADALRQTGGWRASKEIGSAVYNDQNQQVGTIDDMIMSGDKIQMVIISVGGFLGMGSKLVAVQPDQLHFATASNGNDNSNDHKVTMSGATKEALNSQPSFRYQ